MMTVWSKQLFYHIFHACGCEVVLRIRDVVITCGDTSLDRAYMSCARVVTVIRIFHR